MVETCDNLIQNMDLWYISLESTNFSEILIEFHITNDPKRSKKVYV